MGARDGHRYTQVASDDPRGTLTSKPCSVSVLHSQRRHAISAGTFPVRRYFIDNGLGLTRSK